MRKVTQSIASAFKAGQAKRNGSTHTDGQTLFLHGHPIARKVSGRLEISLAGWVTATTCERVNGVLSAFDSSFRIGRKLGNAEARNVQNRVVTPFPSNAWQAVGDVTL